MAKRTCLGPASGERCPVAALVTRGTTRCPACSAVRDKARGTSRERGYDATYEAAKRKPGYVTATHCTNCGEVFTPDNPKTAGHIKSIREYGPNDEGITPQCRRCNYGWRKTNT